MNEERNLPHVFAALPEGIDEVVLVDGGSVDRTIAVARELRPDVVVVQQTRTGKGNALACGFAACTSDIIVMIDADGSTDPAEIPLFVAKLVAGADFVKGSRFDHGGDSHDITPLRKLGNDGLNVVVNVLFGTRFTDLCYGYNAFWAKVVPTLDLPDTSLPRPADGSKLWGDGFEIETMINIRAAVDGMKVGEVGSVEHARIHGVTQPQHLPRRFPRAAHDLQRVRPDAARPAPERPRRRRSPSSGARPPRGHRRRCSAGRGRQPQHPGAGAHRADPRSTGAHVNRGSFHEVGARRTDDIKERFQARTTAED